MSNKKDLGGWAEALDFCPHVNQSITIPDDIAVIPPLDIKDKIECSVADCPFKECWLCLKCFHIYCGRYGRSHMVSHYHEQSISHCIALGIGDLSFWCYQCDSYISHLSMQKVFKMYCMLHMRKFKQNIANDLLQQYKDENEKKDDDNDYELFINMDLHLQESKSRLQTPKNSLIILDSLIATFNCSSNTYLYCHEDTLLHQANKEIHENPDRIIKTVELLSSINMLNKCHLIKIKQCQMSDANIDDNIVKLSDKYKLITHKLNRKMMDEMKWFDSYTFFNKYSHFASQIAYLSCFHLFTNLLKAYSDDRYGFALIRPPGHHCNYSKPMGFCLYNNVAIGINAVRANTTAKAKFMIIDWDIHHGNGTQDIFYDDPDVVYLSIHQGLRQFNGGTSYPSTGSMNDIGGKAAQGTNINIPLNVYSDCNPYGYGDTQYLMLLQELVIPVLKEFKPDLCIISSGFDAGIGDTMGRFRITPIGFGLMTRIIINATKSVAMVLEGGYNLCTMSRSIGCCIYSCLKGKTERNNTLDEYETEFISSLNQCQKTIFNQWKLFDNNIITEQHQQNNVHQIYTVIENVKQKHKTYWKCFQTTK